MSRKEFEVTPGFLIKWIVFGVICILGLCAAFGSFYTVQGGHRAVLLTFGKPSTTAMGEGLHWKWPFIQTIQDMNVQTQKYVTKADASSTDLQVVTTEVAINYHPVPSDIPSIYRDMGMDYSNVVITPAVQECVKACTAQHRAEELITKREIVREQIENMLRANLAKRSIVVESVNIVHFDFSHAFNAAIEAKVTTEQNALAAKNKLEQVKFEADQAIATAKGQAESIKIQAEAIQVQGGANYIQMKAIEKWNGQMPIYVGSGPMPFINVGQSK